MIFIISMVVVKFCRRCEIHIRNSLFGLRESLLFVTFSKIMDSDFIPRVYINGAALGRSVGKVVSIILKPTDAVSSGNWFKADTTDGHNVRVNLSDELNVRIEDWVEVIGIPTSEDTIKCQEIITFSKSGSDFATKSYDVLVGMLANCPDFYNFGE